MSVALGQPPADDSHPTTVAVRAMGRSIPIMVTGGAAEQVAAFAATIGSVWSRCDPRPASAETAETADAPINVDLDRMDDRSALAWASSAVTTRAIEETSSDHLVFHAAACADETSGLAACFVGPSGRGKTTASIALGRAFGYLTDEATAVDADGRVVPYPKPLSVRVPGVAVKEQRSPDALGLRRAPAREWPLGAVFLLDRREGDTTAVPTAQAPTTVRAVPLPDAILALAPELSSLHRLDHGLQRLATLIDRAGPVLRLGYAEASSLAPVVARVLAERSTTPRRGHSDGEHWSPADVEPPAANAPRPTGAHRRVPALDAITVANTLIVLREGSVVAAGGLSPTIWAHTRDWIETDALRDRLVAELGRPDDAEARLSAALTALRSVGLLERTSP